MSITPILSQVEVTPSQQKLYEYGLVQHPNQQLLFVTKGSLNNNDIYSISDMISSHAMCLTNFTPKMITLEYHECNEEPITWNQDLFGQILTCCCIPAECLFYYYTHAYISLTKFFLSNAKRYEETHTMSCCHRRQENDEEISYTY